MLFRGIGAEREHGGKGVKFMKIYILEGKKDI